MAAEVEVKIEPVGLSLLLPTDRADLSQDVLQDRVFVFSLISVLTDALRTAKDLYRRLKQNSRTDDDHDKSKDSTHRSEQERRDSHSNLSEALARHVRWDRREVHHTDSEDKFICTASLQVQATYDRGYRKFGEVFARGDGIVKIQLQTHIIKLQQILIRIHEDLILSNYLAVSSSHSQLVHLVQTVRTTRAAAIQALSLLYQRLLSSPPHENPKPDLHMPEGFINPYHSRRSSSSSSSDSSLPPPRQSPVRPNPNLTKLFCRYALDLQSNHRKPLATEFGLNGNTRCPSCHTYIPIRPGKAWEVIVDASITRPSRRKRFLVRNRFTVKCHREGGGFACVLCAKYGDADTVCRSISALMEHLWKEHTSKDMEKDQDIMAC